MGTAGSTGIAGHGWRRLWRWAVVVWLVAGAVGGGLTLWLQGAAEPPEPYPGEQAEATPTPSLPEDWEDVCPRPTIGPTRTAGGGPVGGPVGVACVIKVGWASRPSPGRGL
jgi:hypothetical protein